MTTSGKIITLFSCLLFLAIFSIPARAQNEIISYSDAPTILETAKIQEDRHINVLVKGLIKPNYDVLIYINGTYAGLANISQGNTIFSKFSYVSANISDVKNLQVTAIGRNNLNNLLTSPTQISVTSLIEKPVLQPRAPKEIINPTNKPVLAPILKTPNSSRCESIPHISGFSKNQTTVKIFIDNKLFTSKVASSSVSEVAFFSYYPIITLERGQHSVYAIAEDTKHNQSPKSNLLTFCVSNPHTIATSSVAENELTTNPNQNTDSETDRLVFQKTNDLKSTTTNSSAKNTAKTNIILFGLFILIVAVWIIYVNKELLDDNKENVSK